MHKILWITFFILFYICYVQSAIIGKDEFVTIEDDPYQNVNEIANPDIESARNERILWPYVAESSTNLENENQTDEKDIKDVKTREKRFLHWSYPQSPIVDMMMQTMSVNYSPNVAGDPFDFLRDSYQLPEGKFFYFCPSSNRDRKTFGIDLYTVVICILTLYD